MCLPTQVILAAAEGRVLPAFPTPTHARQRSHCACGGLDLPLSPARSRFAVDRLTAELLVTCRLHVVWIFLVFCDGILAWHMDFGMAF